MRHADMLQLGRGLLAAECLTSLPFAAAILPASIGPQLVSRGVTGTFACFPVEEMLLQLGGRVD